MPDHKNPSEDPQPRDPGNGKKDPSTSSKTHAAPPDDKFALPPPAVLREIARRQDERARAIRERRAREVVEAAAVEGDAEDDAEGRQRRDVAAQLIQRNYRGYRVRREQLQTGPDERWAEAIKEVKYQHITKPVARSDATSPTESQPVRQRWKRIKAIADRAGNDASSDEEDEDDETGVSPAKRSGTTSTPRQRKREREQYAQMMGLKYFLEMVDPKHRYGSSLRRYHREWTKSDTQDNFFHWLDQGDGKDLDLPDRPRQRLETEMVRYLSREERKKYLVKIDGQGRFCWAKNGSRISTSPGYKDSVDGVVPVDDPTPIWREVMDSRKDGTEEKENGGDPSGRSGAGETSLNSNSKTNDRESGGRKVEKKDTAATDTSRPNPIKPPSASKKTIWIFVADTSFRLYVGIKQSGAFQHSSFLQGARVSAAGQISLRDGQLRSLSPLSGHYAPPLRNFRAFVSNLRSAHADLSHISISKSYAILLGLDVYLAAKRQGSAISRTTSDVLHPDAKRKREEESRDHSHSAEKERLTIGKERELQRRQSRMHRGLRALKLEGKG